MLLVAVLLPLWGGDASSAVGLSTQLGVDEDHLASQDHLDDMDMGDLDEHLFEHYAVAYDDADMFLQLTTQSQFFWGNQKQEAPDTGVAQYGKTATKAPNEGSNDANMDADDGVHTDNTGDLAVDVAQAVKAKKLKQRLEALKKKAEAEKFRKSFPVGSKENPADGKPPQPDKEEAEAENAKLREKKMLKKKLKTQRRKVLKQLSTDESLASKNVYIARQKYVRRLKRQRQLEKLRLEKQKKEEAEKKKSQLKAKKKKSEDELIFLQTQFKELDEALLLDDREHSPPKKSADQDPSGGGPPKEIDETVKGDVIAMYPQNSQVLNLAIMTDGGDTFPVGTQGDGPKLMTEVGDRVAVKGNPVETDAGDIMIQVHGFKRLGPAGFDV